MISYLSKVLYVLSGSRLSLVGLIAVLILTSVLEAIGIGLIGPFLNLASDPTLIEKNELFKRLYTQLNLQSSGQFVALLGGIIAIVFVVKSILYFFSKALIIKFSFGQKGKLCSRLLNAYLSVPYTFHLSRNTSTLIENIVVETNKFCNQNLLQLLNTVSNVVVTFVLLILLFKTSSLFLGLILLTLLPLLLIFYKLGGVFRMWGKQASESQKEIIRIINHSLGGIKETRVIGCEPYFEEQMDHQVEILERSVTLFQSFQLLPRITIETALVLVIIIFVSVFALQSVGQDLTSVLGVFAVASVRFIPSVSQFIQGVGNIQNSAYALDMLYFDLKEIEKVEAASPMQQFSEQSNHRLHRHVSSTSIMNFNKQIDLNQITYRYPNAEDYAIKDISLTIKKGQSIAFIGKSGAGKTTLVDIILGLLELQDGNIEVDGISIYHDLRAWQNLIGYIPQTIFLTDDTVEQNIAFGVPPHLIDAARLEKAIQSAQLEELVDQLPDGVKTHVGERGVRLSGGQRQRIGIARALYHEREILVLDEATSALDHETETLVNEAIRSLSGRKTMIIIAHRLSTVEHCDHVFQLDRGCIAKSGGYQEVVAPEI